jgi:hypothetical protein
MRARVRVWPRRRSEVVEYSMVWHPFSSYVSYRGDWYSFNPWLERAWYVGTQVIPLNRLSTVVYPIETTFRTTLPPFFGSRPDPHIRSLVNWNEPVLYNGKPAIPLNLLFTIQTLPKKAWSTSINAQSHEFPKDQVVNLPITELSHHSKVDHGP